MDTSLSIASIQEGEEWIARLRDELDALVYDLVNFSDVLNEHTVNNIRHAIDQIQNYIAEISVEIGLIGDEDE